MGALQDTSQSTEVSKLLSCRIRSSYRITVTFRGRGGGGYWKCKSTSSSWTDLHWKDLGCVFTSQYVIDSSYHQYITSLTAPTTSTSTGLKLCHKGILFSFIYSPFFYFLNQNLHKCSDSKKCKVYSTYKDKNRNE